MTGLEINRFMADASIHGWPPCVSAMVADMGKSLSLRFEGKVKTQSGDAPYAMSIEIRDCGNSPAVVQVAPGLVFLAMMGKAEKPKPNINYSAISVDLVIKIEGYGSFNFDRKYESVEIMLKNLPTDVSVLNGGFTLIQSLPRVMSDYFADAVAENKNAG